MLRSTHPEQVISVIANLSAENTYIDVQLSPLLVKMLPSDVINLHIADEDNQKLTLRERQVLGFLVQGLSNKEIANQLYISLFTVKFHLSNIYKKLDVSSRQELLYRIAADGVLIRKKQN